MAGQAVDLGSVYATLQLRTQDFDNSVRHSESLVSGLGQTMLGVFGGNLLYGAFTRITGAVTDFGKQIFYGGVEAQTLSTALKVIGRNSGYSEQTLKDFNTSLKNMNILGSNATQAMLNLLNAGIPLNDTTKKLAESAQNIATAYGKDTATTFANMTQAITNMNPMLLQQYGITENLDVIFKRYADTHGLVASKLTETEKRMALMNLINEKGAQFAGVYAEAQGNVGKKLEQLQSRLKTVAEGIGQALLPAVYSLVAPLEKTATAAAKWLNSDEGKQRIKEIGEQILVVAKNITQWLVGAFNAVYPIVKKVFDVMWLLVSNVFEWINRNGETVRVILVGIGTALGTLLVVTTVISVFTALAGVLSGISLPIVAVLVAIAALASGIYYLYKKSESFRNAIATVGDVLASLWNAIKLVATGDFKGGIFGVAEDDKLITFLLGLHKALVIVWGVLSGAFKQAWVTIVDIWNTTLLPALKEIWAVVEQNKKVFMVLGGILLALAVGPYVLLVGGIILALKWFKFISPVIKVVINVIGELIEAIIKIANFIINVFIFSWNAAVAVVQFFIGVWNGLVTAVTTVWNTTVTALTAIYNTFVSVFTAIWNFISPILEFIKNLYIIVFGSILIVVLTVLNAIWGAVQTVWNAVWGFLEPIINKIKNLVVNTFNSVKDFVISIWNTIYNTITSIVQRVINFFAPAFSWLLEKGKDIIRGLVNGISSMAGAVWDAIKGVADQIGKFFSGVGNWLFDSGKALFEGFIKGMKSIAGKVKETAENIVKSVRNLLPFSPAKEGPFSGKGWTLYSGRSLMKGLAEGIESYSKMPLEAMNRALSGVQLPSAVTASSRNTAQASSVNIYGDISISNQQDADYLMQRLSRQQDLTFQGLVGV